MPVEKLGDSQQNSFPLGYSSNGITMDSTLRDNHDGKPSNRERQPSGATSISVAVDPVTLITTECITVTSAMRKHARWAHSSVSAILGGSPGPGQHPHRPTTPGDNLIGRKGDRNMYSFTDGVGLASRWGLRGKRGKSMQDNPLMAGFGRLRRDLMGCKGKLH